MKEFFANLPSWVIPMVIVILVTVAIMTVLYFVGKKLQKRKDEQDAQMAAVAQTIPMLIIDKKKMRMCDAGLPQSIMDQTPKMMRRTKMPIVKAKVGPKTMSLICDASIFDDIPVKTQVKATVSGIYITGVKGMRKPIEKDPNKKETFMQKLRKKAGM